MQIREIPEKGARYVYLIQVCGAQNFPHICMCIEFLIQVFKPKNAHACFPVGMVPLGSPDYHCNSKKLQSVSVSVEFRWNMGEGGLGARSLKKFRKSLETISITSELFAMGPVQFS